MAELMSNEDVSQLGIYAGVAAGAGAVGLAYGADIFDPLYNEDVKRNRQAAKEKKTKTKYTRDQAIKDAAERATQAHQRNNSYATQVAAIEKQTAENNQVWQDQERREARTAEKYRNQHEGNKYNPLDMVGDGNVGDTASLSKPTSIVMDNPHVPSYQYNPAAVQAPIHGPTQSNLVKKRAANAYKKAINVMQKVL